MKKENIPKALGTMLSRGQTGADGAHKYGATLVLVHNGEIAIQGDTDAAIKANDEYQSAVAASPLAAAAFKAADIKATTLITVSRDLLKPVLGVRYSKAWNAVGYFNPSLRVPRTSDQRRTLVNSLRAYLEANPDKEVVGVMTAAIASTVFTELSDAMSAWSDAQVTQRQKRVARDAAMKVLRTRLQNLFHELKQLMSDNDPRWIDFGFNVPSDLSIPEAPEGFAVMPGIAGHVMMSWQRPVGATRFRIFGEVVGVNTKPVAMGKTGELSMDLGSLASGAHVRLYVVAGNAAGESLPSQTVEVVVP
jgi:hypothetical protein